MPLQKGAPWRLKVAARADTQALHSAVEYEASVYMIAGDAAPGRRSFLKPSKVRWCCARSSHSAVHSLPANRQDGASNATPIDETDVADDDMAETYGCYSGTHNLPLTRSGDPIDWAAVMASGDLARATAEVQSGNKAAIPSVRACGCGDARFFSVFFFFFLSSSFRAFL